MAEIIPFHGLRYIEGKAGSLGDLICPPYDVIGDAQRNALYRRSEHNFVRVEHGRPEPGDAPGSDRYTRAKDLLDDWLGKGVVRIDPTPAFYLYDHHFELGGEHVRRRGFLGALRLYQMGRGVVRPHEHTTPKDKADRLSLLRATRVNTSPIFGLFEDGGGRVAGMIEQWTARGAASPVADARVGDERHVLWALDDRALTQQLATQVKDARIYLADGHHRYEVALEYLKEENEQGNVHFPEDTQNFVLAYLCALDDPGLRIMPTHRLVQGANAALDEAVAKSFDAAPTDKGGIADTQPGIVLVRDGRFTRLEPRANVDLSALHETWRGLPIAQAEALLVGPARSAGATVTYEHDTDRAIDAAKDGASAVLVRAVDAMTLKKVADAWERLPAKTTYFYPKVPAGLVARPLGE